MSRVPALLAAAGLAALLSAGSAVTTVQATEAPGAISWDSVPAGDGSGAISWDSIPAGDGADAISWDSVQAADAPGAISWDSAEVSAPAAQQNAISWD
ncbi:hypothetical protein [Streptomyces sp. NPDC003327]